MLPSRLPALRPEPDARELPGDLHVAAGPAHPLAPQRPDGAGLLGPHHRVRLEDGPAPGELGLERGHRVLGQRAGVHPAAQVHQVLPGVQLRAAGQAGDRAQHLLAAAGGGRRDDVLVADEPGQVAARAAAFLDVRGDRADRGIGQVTRHPAQRRGLVDDIGVNDHDGLGPAVRQDVGQPVVERGRLALTAPVPPQRYDPPGVLGRLGRGHLRGGVGAGVIHHHNPQRVRRVVELHQPVHRGADDRRLVPGRDDDRDPGEERRALCVVQPAEVQPDQQELVVTYQQRQRSQHDQRHQQPLESEQDAGHRGGSFTWRPVIPASRPCRSSRFCPTSSRRAAVP